MLQFCANLSLLFTEQPLLERFAAARQAGFSAVEIQFPYELPAERIRQVLREQGLRLVLFNVDADTLLQGGEGLAAVPEKRELFRVAVANALAYAELLKPEVINVLPGRCFSLDRLTVYRQTLVENLRYAADLLADAGVTPVFEAVNSYDMPGFIIDDHAKMLALLSDVGHPALRLQYDIYHMTRMRQDCNDFIRRHLDKIAHFQFADCPGRGEPGSGSVNFAELFGLVDSLRYRGWLGAEYKPTGESTDSLEWMESPLLGNSAVF
jgi:hydroxypyruvate isomerase